MFRRNDTHQQASFFNTVDDLSRKHQQRLDESWAGEFYRQVFTRIDEVPFAALYAETDSRPNTPVNVLLSFEFLKAGFGWSDAETYDHFCFDLQVRYAIGYRGLREGHFELRTVYNFRRRLLAYYTSTGTDLAEQAFERITDAQRHALGVKASQLRMDSTFVSSNIRNFSRLQLLVEVLQRVWRMLSPTDRLLYVREMTDYVRQSPCHLIQHLSKEEHAQHLQRIGEVMGALVPALAPRYGDHPTYALLQRVYEEHYQVQEAMPRPRKSGEFPPACLQAPDDPEATARIKSGEMHKGYVVNLTETCSSDNDLQLIVKVQTETNSTSDQRLLEGSLLSLFFRHQLETLYTDGGYNNESLYTLMRHLGVEHWQTGIQGRSSTLHLPLGAYEVRRSQANSPASVLCPHGQVGQVSASRKAEHYRAHFARDGCAACPWADQCLASATSQGRTLHFSAYDLAIAQRRVQIAAWEAQGRNPRAAVESTVYSVIRPFPEQVPVRGRFRTHALMVGSAVMVNVRRITRWQRRHLTPSLAPNPCPTSPMALGQSLSCLFHRLLAQVGQFWLPRWLSLSLG